MAKLNGSAYKNAMTSAKMEAAVNKSNVLAVAKESFDYFVRRFDMCLKECLSLSLHPTPRDALSELSRSELTFLMLLFSLAKKDVQLSCIFLQAVEDWSVFPRVTSYFSGKLDIEWDVPDEMIINAVDFANTLKQSGLVKVPDTITKYLQSLLEYDDSSNSEEYEDEEGDYPEENDYFEAEEEDEDDYEEEG